MFILDQSITPLLQAPVEVFQMVLALTVIGVVHQYPVSSLVHMLSRPWIFTIPVGNTIPLHYQLQAVVWLLLLNLLIHLPKGQPEAVPIFQDRDLYHIHSSSVTGIYVFIKATEIAYFVRVRSVLIIYKSCRVFQVFNG